MPTQAIGHSPPTGSALLAGEARLLRYADVLGVEIVRDPSLRLNGYPTLRIERRGAPPLRVSTIGLGVLGELNQLLATAVASGQPQLVGIVVPLRKRALAEAAARARPPVRSRSTRH
jgi:hypothetical protein